MKSPFVLVTAFSAACGLPIEDDGDDTAGDGGDDVVREVVGPEGGTLAGHGVQLVIPAGALADEVELSLQITDDPPAEGVVAVSPVVRFGPAGTTFAQPVHVTMEMEHDGFATLYWSVPGDDTSFEAIGVGAAGLAEGWTTHFSVGFTGQGACEPPTEDPTTTKCGCRAGDEVEDLLCPEDPTQTGGVCDDILGHSGSEGGGCSGYGLRDMIMYSCSCLSGDGDYLCPDAHIFEPSQQCPTEGGLNGYIVEEPMGSCSGTTVVVDPETQEPMNESKSGTLVECQSFVESSEYESVSGTLENCTTTSEADDGTCPADPEDPPQPEVSELCQQMIAELEQRRATNNQARTACAEPPNAATVGTEIGQHLELGLFATDDDHISQLKVPFGSKSQCNEDPDERTTPGYLDLVEVVSRDAETKTVTIRIAEIKPMTADGLADGRNDLECYRDRVADAGARCKTTKGDGTGLAEYVDFCHELGALEQTVVLADDWKLRWAPEGTFMHTFMAAPGDTRQVIALVCEDGITAYQCVEG